MITEARLQHDIFMWTQEKGYYCFHCPNGEKRDKITAAKLKGMGVRAGVPDLIFIFPKGVTLWVELKLKDKDLNTKQEEFKAMLQNLSHHYLLVQADSLEEAVPYLEPELSRICRLVSP